MENQRKHINEEESWRRNHVSRNDEFVFVCKLVRDCQIRFHTLTGKGFHHHRETFAHCPWVGNAPLSTQSITGYPGPKKKSVQVLRGVNLRRDVSRKVTSPTWEGSEGRGACSQRFSIRRVGVLPDPCEGRYSRTSLGADEQVLLIHRVPRGIGRCRVVCP